MDVRKLVQKGLLLGCTGTDLFPKYRKRLSLADRLL